MEHEKHYLDANRQLWNDKVAHHLASDFYDLPAFLGGKSSLNGIELALLGELSGQRVLHLQCHFGQDSLSMARMGAQVTGVDLSDKAIDAARELNRQMNLDAQFVCSDVYDLPQQLQGSFDVVFTSYGTIGWLPDLDKWASVIRHFLKPGGRLVFAEFHPVVWMFDEDFRQISYDYFNTRVIVETTNGTYADTDAPISGTSVNWNHNIAEVLQALLRQGLQLSSFEEFDYSPYNCFKGMTENAPGQYRIAHLDKQIPMVYALAATKPL